MPERLLTEAGYPDGVTISGGMVRQSEAPIAEAVQGYRAQAGMADDVMVMYAGQVVEYVHVDELFRKKRNGTSQGRPASY